MVLSADVYICIPNLIASLRLYGDTWKVGKHFSSALIFENLSVSTTNVVIHAPMVSSSWLGNRIKNRLIWNCSSCKSITHSWFFPIRGSNRCISGRISKSSFLHIVKRADVSLCKPKFIACLRLLWDSWIISFHFIEVLNFKCFPVDTINNVIHTPVLNLMGNRVSWMSAS